MKLNPIDVHPENNTMHLAVKIPSKGNSMYSGYVGVVLFKDGTWYSMPGENEMKPPFNNFMWLEL